MYGKQCVGMDVLRREDVHVFRRTFDLQNNQSDVKDLDEAGVGKMYEGWVEEGGCCLWLKWMTLIRLPVIR